MKLETLSNCPVCNGKTFDPFLEVQDHSVSHGTFHIVKCKKCGFLFTNPRPTEDSIAAFYDSSGYISHHDDTDSLMSKIYGQVRRIAVKNKLDLIKKYDHDQEKNILDIGCGTGFFIKSCRDQRWQVSGTEPDDDARSAAQKRTNVQIYPSVFDPGLEESQFTSITMWHVLEHIHRIDETMSWLYQHLAPKGTLYIAVPNPQSYDSQVFGKHWAAYDVPRHLYHFTKDTMEKLLLHHNFAIADLKCMVFDSYYVSLLSNQYKNKSSRPLSSVITGTLSNIKGFGTNPHNTNTSSIIYIAHKK